MRFLSTFSGIEAASVAWEPLGMEPVAFAEVEPFASSVLAHHWPDVPNLGDVTEYESWPDMDIDILVGGSPCQAFSSAGPRGGLDDPRGRLMLTYLGIADRYRPDWIVWENVPGVLSTDGGRAFGTFLGALDDLGYGFAYRVLDAQFVRTRGHPRAVPQRRRRVFVVAYLGDWRPPAALLFDPESLRGRPPPRRETQQAPAGAAGSGDVAAGRGGADLIVMAHGQGQAEVTVDLSPTLTCNHEQPIVRAPHALAFDVKGGLAPHGNPTLTPVAHALKASDARDPQVVAIDVKGSKDWSLTDGSTQTLRAVDHAGVASAPDWAVRRFVPVEYERLQGFPDGHTLVPGPRRTPRRADELAYLQSQRPDLAEDDLRRLSADTGRYAALGNSMPVNSMEWIGERLVRINERLAQGLDPYLEPELADHIQAGEDPAAAVLC